jgi:hypothetical protein
MAVLLSVVTHAVAFAGGAFVWPHISGLLSGVVKNWSASRAVANAKAVLAAEEARVAALAHAKSVVAATPAPAPAPAATGATGPAPAPAPAATGATGPTGA